MTSSLSRSAGLALAAAPDVGPDMDDVGRQIAGMAAQISAATCNWLLLIARFDANEGYDRAGLASTAQWLAHHCGIAHRTAAEHVRVARSLAVFPELAAAMCSGSISYSQARAITRVPREGETMTMHDLIELARAGTVGQLETVLRGMRTADANATEGGDGAGAEEYLRFGWASDLSRSITARLDAERGELVRSAIATVARAYDLTAAEALGQMAEIALAVLNDQSTPPRPLRGDERAAVLVHLDLRTARHASVERDSPSGAAGRSGAQAGKDDTSCADTGGVHAGGARTCGPDPDGAGTDSAGTDSAGTDGAETDSTDTGGACTSDDSAGSVRLAGRAHMDDGPGLSWSAIRRLLCGGRVRTAVYDTGGNVRDLGRSRRVVPERMFRALLIRDGHCRHPGCTSRAGLQAHHVQHWIDGGRTDPANLVLLCERHHHRLHDGCFVIETCRGQRFRFRRADGTELESRPDPSRHTNGAPTVVDRFADVRATPPTRGGERLDRPWAVAVLCGRRESASRSTETDARRALITREQPMP